MEAVLRRDSLTETHKDVEKLIRQICYKFYKTHGGDFEEWIAEANLIFIETYDSYNNKRAEFSTWLSLHVWRRLLAHKKRMHKQCPPTFTNIGKDLGTIKFIVDTSTLTKPFFSSTELLDGLREDTKTLINIIWQPPPAITKAKMKPGPNPCHIKIVLKNHLRKLGWSWRRIKESFKEIEDVINA